MQNISTRKGSYMEEKVILFPGGPVSVRRDLNSYFNSMTIRITGDIHPYFHYVHDNYGVCESDAYHLYTCVSNSNRPWVVTCEHLYTNKDFFLERLLRENCRRIFTISEWLYEEQFLKSSKNLAPILEKLEVFKPRVRAIVRDLDDLSGIVRFIFIGRDFFRKGGLPMLRALSSLLARYRNWELSIISELNTADYPECATKEDVKEVRSLIDSMGCVSHFESLPNDEVMEMIKGSHVGLCPTYLDTYGISVLEFMSASLPVVVSNVMAMTEMVDEARGWVAKLPVSTSLDRYKRVDRSSRGKRNALDGILERELQLIFEDILSNPSQILEKSKNTQSYIIREHDPEKGADRLREVYREF